MGGYKYSFPRGAEKTLGILSCQIGFQTIFLFWGSFELVLLCKHMWFLTPPFYLSKINTCESITIIYTTLVCGFRLELVKQKLQLILSKQYDFCEYDNVVKFGAIS